MKDKKFVPGIAVIWIVSLAAVITISGLIVYVGFGRWRDRHPTQARVIEQRVSDSIRRRSADEIEARDAFIKRLRGSAANLNALADRLEAGEFAPTNRNEQALSQ